MEGLPRSEEFGESRFYKQLIKKADARFEAHLAQLKTQQEEK
jgi:hypothetical protein